MRTSALILAVPILCAACARDRAPETWLEHARKLSDAAEEAQKRGDRAAAREALLSMFEAPPPSRLNADDARSIRQDVCFRLALVELEDGKPAAALTFAERGLSLGKNEDVFSANLHIARGRALEALGRDAEAAKVYHEALKINERLLEQALATQGDR